MLIRGSKLNKMPKITQKYFDDMILTKNLNITTFLTISCYKSEVPSINRLFVVDNNNFEHLCTNTEYLRICGQSLGYR